MTGAPANKLTRLSVEYSLTEHCNISCHACAHASPLLAEKFAAWLEEDGQALIDDVARRLLPPRGLRSTLRGVKELLKGRP